MEIEVGVINLIHSIDIPERVCIEIHMTLFQAHPKSERHVTQYLTLDNDFNSKFSQSPINNIFSYLESKFSIQQGHVIISGSYSLMLYELYCLSPTCFLPNDVDFYVTNIHADQFVTIVSHIQQHFPQYIFLQTDIINCQYCSEDCYVIENLKIHDSSQNETYRLQIILPKMLYPESYHNIKSPIDLAHWVTSRYDISIVKSAILSPSVAASGVHFFFLSKQVQTDISNRRFSYKVREGHKQQHDMVNRIEKYISRGYNIYEITFENSALTIRVCQSLVDGIPIAIQDEQILL
jgi:hypothetical protein